MAWRLPQNKTTVFAINKSHTRAYSMVFPFPSYASDWLELRYMHVSNSLLILFYHIHTILLYKCWWISNSCADQFQFFCRDSLKLFAPVGRIWVHILRRGPKVILVGNDGQFWACVCGCPLFNVPEVLEV